MKIRFGVSLGADVGPGELSGIVDYLEAAGVDSLWFSELVYSKAVDPFVGMSFALARTKRLKVGTSVAVLPGRHPVLVANSLHRCRRSRRSGSCRSLACVQRCPPNATSSWCPKGNVRQCSMSRCNCCASHCAMKMSPSPATTSRSGEHRYFPNPLHRSIFGSAVQRLRRSGASGPSATAGWAAS